VRQAKRSGAKHSEAEKGRESLDTKMCLSVIKSLNAYRLSSTVGNYMCNISMKNCNRHLIRKLQHGLKIVGLEAISYVWSDESDNL
jgi:hypothetical protein